MRVINNTITKIHIYLKHHEVWWRESSRNAHCAYQVQFNVIAFTVLFLLASSSYPQLFTLHDKLYPPRNLSMLRHLPDDATQLRQRENINTNKKKTSFITKESDVGFSVHVSFFLLLFHYLKKSKMKHCL